MDITKDNLIIQSFWYGPELSKMEILCIKSFIDQGHIFHLYCYEDINSLPQDCILKNANDIVDVTKIFYDSIGGISGFSNYFRINLLNLRGGWWVDMDMICLKPFNFNKEYSFCSEYKLNGSISITNCCIKSSPNSEFLTSYIKIVDEMLLEYDVIPWLSTGPILINKLLRLFDADEFIHPPNVFCPINYFEVKNLVSANGVMPKDSTAIHLYNEMWRRNKMQKNKDFYKSSIYEKLKKKYEVINN